MIQPFPAEAIRRSNRDTRTSEPGIRAPADWQKSTLRGARRATSSDISARRLAIRRAANAAKGSGRSAVPGAQAAARSGGMRTIEEPAL